MYSMFQDLSRRSNETCFLRIWDTAQIRLVALKIVFNVSRFKPTLKWNLFLADLRRGSNSLNSDSLFLFFKALIKFSLTNYQRMKNYSLKRYNLCNNFVHCAKNNIFHFLISSGNYQNRKMSWLIFNFL